MNGMLARTGLIAVLVTSSFTTAIAQVPADPPATAPPESAGGDRVPTAPLLDAPVSRTEYLLGPGDVLELSLFGDLNRVFTLPVTPEGTVVVPTVGVVRVLGVNLDDAQARVRDAVFRFYRNVSVNLTLSRVRTFKVFVVGAVPRPGVRVASAATRVSEILPPENGVVQRNVLLRRASGDSMRVDLVRFVQTGDLRANPTLREGDALLVPTADEQVQVYGRVFFPGPYEYRAGETLAELLTVANGGGAFPSNAADSVRLTRFTGSAQREFLAFSRAEATGERGRRFVLQPFDAVYVSELSNFRVQRIATIQGQVVRPGTYPIRPDTTTVRELVALAGGFTPEASLSDATLRRQPRGRRVEGVRELQGLPPELLRPEEREILRVRSQGDEANVVIDFRDTFAAGRDAGEQTLQSGDYLTVPERRNDVIVLGAVRSPGIVPFVPGRSVAEYAARAGGFTRRADRGSMVVLRPAQGAPVDASEVASLDPGDTVIVPFRDRQSFLQRISAFNGVIGTVSGLALTLLALGQLF